MILHYSLLNILLPWKKRSVCMIERQKVKSKSSAVACTDEFPAFPKLVFNITVQEIG